MTRAGLVRRLGEIKRVVVSSVLRDRIPRERRQDDRHDCEATGKVPYHLGSPWSERWSQHPSAESGETVVSAGVWSGIMVLRNAGREPTFEHFVKRT